MEESKFLIPDYFKLLADYGGKSANDCPPEIHSKLREVYDKLGEIAEEMKKCDFGIKIIKNPRNQGQKYEEYHWARLCPKYSSDSYNIVYFVIDFTKNGFGMHIDYNQREKAYIDEAMQYQSWESIPVDEVCNMAKSEIVEKVKCYCNNHKLDFIKFGKEYNIKSCVDLLNSYYMNTYKTLLTNNHNLILTGAPGTGKTYLAKEIAKAMGCTDDEIGFVQFHPSYDYTDFVEGLRPKDDNNQVGFERMDGVFKEFCKKALRNLKDSQKSKVELARDNAIVNLLSDFIAEAKELQTIFHTNTKGVDFLVYDYAKSKLKIRIPQNEKANDIRVSISELKELLEKMPTIESGADTKAFFNRKYRLQEDTYLASLYLLLKDKVPTYTETQQVEKKNFVFIIDEINRGEISKIFGELFFSIDPGYRGVDENGKPKGLVQTQYQNLVEDDDDFKKGFFVPENVYIIGTMNDIDRSVESMDFAFRRRFAFKEIKADENIGMLDELGGVKKEAGEKMSALNNAISKISGLNSAYHIGGAYFLKLKNYDNNFDELWANHLDGLLREYLRGRRQEEIEKEMKNLKQAYDSAN